MLKSINISFILKHIFCMLIEEAIFAKKKSHKNPDGFFRILNIV